MDFFHEHKKQIVIFTVLALLAVSLVTMGKKVNGTIVNGPLSFIVVPLQKATTKVGSFFGGIKNGFTDNTAVIEENKQMKERIAALEADNKRLQLQEVQNKKLSSLLDISQKYSAFATTGTHIIAKDPGNWYDVFLIDKGAGDSVTTNSVLVDSGGLVGRVTEVSLGFSRAQSILDSRSAVSAVSVRTGDLGVVKGDYTLMNDGLCLMEYIDAEAEIVEGDEIITSPLSDIYPPGIVIGTVREIRQDSNGLTKYAIIAPQVDFKHLDTLLLINQDKNGEE